MDRRGFLKASAAATFLAANAHAAGSDDTIRIGLVGCGSRGTGAATQALRADKNVKLVAMADAFQDRLDLSLATLKKDKPILDKIDVTPERSFVGFDAYKQLLPHVDVVLLCEPPHFRPSHLKAAIEAGKHVFAEKPCAVDAPGVRSVLETCAGRKRRNCRWFRPLPAHDNGFSEIIKRVHEARSATSSRRANDYRGGRWTAPSPTGPT